MYGIFLWVFYPRKKVLSPRQQLGDFQVLNPHNIYQVTRLSGVYEEVQRDLGLPGGHIGAVAPNALLQKRMVIRNK